MTWIEQVSKTLCILAVCGLFPVSCHSEFPMVLVSWEGAAVSPGSTPWERGAAKRPIIQGTIFKGKAKNKVKYKIVSTRLKDP